MILRSNGAEPRLAFFVSPHGFGHATRACAVMAAIRTVRPAVGFEIFTLTPRWLFERSLGKNYTYHELLTDVGLVQLDPLREDLSQTIASLDAYLPFDPGLIKQACSDAENAESMVHRPIVTLLSQLPQKRSLLHSWMMKPPTCSLSGPCGALR